MNAINWDLRNLTVQTHSGLRWTDIKRQLTGWPAFGRPGRIGLERTSEFDAAQRRTSFYSQVREGAGMAGISHSLSFVVCYPRCPGYGGNPPSSVERSAVAISLECCRGLLR